MMKWLRTLTAIVSILSLQAVHADIVSTNKNEIEFIKTEVIGADGLNVGNRENYVELARKVIFKKCYIDDVNNCMIIGSEEGYEIKGVEKVSSKHNSKFYKKIAATVGVAVASAAIAAGAAFFAAIAGMASAPAAIVLAIPTIGPIILLEGLGIANAAGVLLAGYGIISGGLYMYFSNMKNDYMVGKAFSQEAIFGKIKVNNLSTYIKKLEDQLGSIQAASEDGQVLH
jgi:hypothetical protein